ncbi:hypothetical protein TVAG_194480 [Trichomonas vaginalis G3]|uniref:Thioredoxin domain-containing protein n=1 Tax=Trichomonas vaginalis (strain ATCC PRA-98 / G3) TaxID=412133 RepID=A2ESB9_TRIV3|nr:cell redox homeostasis [Trichomonas vaginalis G3]EAY04483.1 hypothetical protein TVAG_194480 [Trichomonas vaginalis G3]KAI5510236.1 cell redox homeostasis [Trichomonas vaginalis G3]|eukprot:XP_001316706.1 hypothetical protein [Trichomonas vaginalis G3]
MPEIIRFHGGIEELSSTIINYKGTSILVFDASWCPGCRRLSRFLPNYAAEFHSLQFIVIDTDENSQVKTYFGIENLPVIKFCNDKSKLHVETTIVGLNMPLIKEKLAIVA